MTRHLDNRLWLLALLALAVGLTLACSSSTTGDDGGTPENIADSMTQG